MWAERPEPAPAVLQTGPVRYHLAGPGDAALHTPSLYHSHLLGLSTIVYPWGYLSTFDAVRRSSCTCLQVVILNDLSFVTFGDSEWTEAYHRAIAVIRFDRYVEGPTGDV